jgi:uncharacterized protein YqgQ
MSNASKPSLPFLVLASLTLLASTANLIHFVHGYHQFEPSSDQVILQELMRSITYGIVSSSHSRHLFYIYDSQRRLARLGILRYFFNSSYAYAIIHESIKRQFNASPLFDSEMTRA